MAYTKDYEGIASAIIIDAYVFEGEPIEPGIIPSKRFFTHNACWDTGAEVTMISTRVVEALGLEPFEHTSLMGIGGDEEVGVYLIHLGLPNGYLYRNLIVYASDIDDYDVLIGMNLISQSDFFITNIGGNNHFAFDIPATGMIG
jgi:predicted aspartyl protease